MKITNVQIQNFMKLSEATLSLDDRGLLLIQGKNQDNSAATSNGAGKSSIVDAICWALYGTTARDVSGDGVVNRQAKKNCSVTVQVDDDGKKYQIIRERKPNRLTVMQDNADGTFTELTKGTEKETQLVIDNIMGCSLEVFSAAVYAGQEAMPDLPRMTDKQLKLMIEEAAGVEVLAAAYGESRSKAIDADMALKNAEAAVGIATTGLTSAQSNASAMEASVGNWQAERVTKVKGLLVQAKTAKEELEKAEAAVASFDEAALTAELASVELAADSFKPQSVQLARLQGVANDSARALSTIMAKVSLYQGQRVSAQADLARVHSQVGQPCKACGKPHEAADLEAVENLNKVALKEVEDRLRAGLVEAKSLKATSEADTKMVDDWKAAMLDPSAVQERRKEVTAKLKALTDQKAHRNVRALELSRIINAAKDQNALVNPFVQLFEDAKKVVEQRDKALSEAKSKVAPAKEEAELALAANLVFGPGGVRAHILDTVTPFLNDRTAEYVGSLTDGDISAVWSTLSRTAKGEVREKFSIDVSSLKDSETFAGLSGGEKRKVRLGCFLALQDLVATRASKPINLFIADEIDHALDEAGLERLMGLLEKKARERGTVLVISHNSLSDWIDNVMTVVKKDGSSTLEGATT